MRVVFDTNIYISAFAIPGDQAEDAYLKAIQGDFELFASVPILTETTTVLQRKFDWPEDRARAVVQDIAHVATIVVGMTRLAVVNDDPDNRILECAADWSQSGRETASRRKTREKVRLETYRRCEPAPSALAALRPE